MQPASITTFYRRADLPALSTMSSSSTSDTDSYTTPSVTVPPNHNNPYILRTHSPSGTVFIAVGAIVGAILLGFILYHLILSLSASKAAKKTSSKVYDKYSGSTAYTGLSLTTTLGNEFVAASRLPLLTQSPSKSFSEFAHESNVGDTSTIYQSEVGLPATKHDFSKMFISPTAEAMAHKRKSLFDTNSFSVMSGSTINLSEPSFAKVPHMAAAASEPSEAGSNRAPEPESRTRTNPARKSIPSMYLDDLIDN